ncbi:MAG: LysR family transcriptional regulator [Coriobacteriales bacterium]|nr:LysR family transcriptional regulator [Coriobacteriales bacterium]
MSIHYLEEFLVLVRYMNFTSAARYLNLTQSALSKHIAALEKEFNSNFFDRSGQHIELTEQGRAFCIDALQMLNLYQATQTHMRSTGLEVRLAGAIDDPAIHSLISAARAKQVETDPGFTLALTNNPAQSLLDLLLAMRIDMYIDVALEVDVIDPACETCILAVVPLVAIANSRHPLVKKEKVCAEDLRGLSIMYPTGSLICRRGADAVESFFNRHNVSTRSSIFFADSVKDFPLASIGDDVFVTPRSNFSRQLFANIMDDYYAVPFAEPDAAFPYRLVWRKGEDTQRVLTFRDTLVATSDQLHPGNRQRLDW